MGLNLVKQTIGAVAPVFVKVFELFTGGFSLSTSGYNSGTKVPAGSLIKVDEDARTATILKSAKLTADMPSSTALKITTDSHFQVGDYVHMEDWATSYSVASITEGDDEDYLVITTGIGDYTAVGTGDVVYQVEAATVQAEVELTTVANGVVRYDTYMGDTGSGDEVTVVSRGTVYGNRLQAHIDGHLADLDHIRISKSK